MTTKEAVTGWRIWRVLPFERLDGRRAMRLCAVGTYGVPKLWEPRRATVAVCSSGGDAGRTQTWRAWAEPDGFEELTFDEVLGRDAA